MSQATLTDRPYWNSNLFSSHYLDERIQDREEWDCDEAASEALTELQQLHDVEGDLVAGYDEDPLVDNWIDKVLDVLGFGTQTETTLPGGGGFVDSLLFENEQSRRDSVKVYLDTEDTTDLFDRGVGILEAKQWDANFDQRFSEQRPYRNASHQIKHYLERTPENIQWGILTNGRKWRLYGTKDYETQTYYEVDLPALLERGDLEDFKYFYVFFRPAAFRESAETTFIDEVWSDSETAAQELGEDLQDNVFTALRVLGRGFVETNNLDIDTKDEAGLDELKEQSLVLLYRLMFVLYAESRGLIHPEGAGAEAEYEQNFSLDALRLDIHESIGEVDTGFDAEFSEYSTTMWSRLTDLFRLIDEGEAALGIPPYNGGLFDREKHAFLTDQEVSNRYLAEVIYRLSTTENGDGRYVLADYADLDTRHLGSVYEGLLEHQFRIASEDCAAVAEDGSQVWKPATDVTVADAVETVSKGGLYVVNDQGERKATGAYYTPDYVVTYIVEETIGPLVEDIREDLINQGFEPGTQEYLGPFLRRVTQLKILDPAMGSGHFLTRATEYLADEVMSEVREVEAELGVAFDEQHVRREIAKECIYGVDLNGMAVELAKLSMWLETLAVDRPLAFLDHHLKEGNSLVGSDIESIEELESDVNGDKGQYSLAEFGATREGTIERLMDIYGEFLNIENDTVEDVREMKRKYAEIEQDELRRRLVSMANVHTAERFGLDIPGGAYERMAKALEDDSKWDDVNKTDWFKIADKLANEQEFFHWRLAFPEAFYQEDGKLKDRAGFDVVIGNPPYVRVQRIPERFADYLFEQYATCSEKTDLSLPFLELATKLVHGDGLSGFISTSQWMTTRYGESAREYMGKGKVSEILDFGTLPVFPNISTYPSIFILSGGSQTDLRYGRVRHQDQLNINAVRNIEFTHIDYDRLDSRQWVLSELDLRTVLPSRNSTVELGELGHFHIGAITGSDEVFVVSKDEIEENGFEDELVYDYAHRNSEIKKYGDVQPENTIIYPYRENGAGETELINESRLEQNYPNVYEHFKENEETLRQRKDSREFYAKGEDWYQFLRPGKFEYIAPEKLLFRGLAKASCVGWLDEDTVFSGNNCPGYIPDNDEYDDGYLVGILNSDLISVYLTQISPAKQQGYTRFNATDLNEVPIRTLNTESDSDLENGLLSRCENIIEGHNIGQISVATSGVSGSEIHQTLSELVAGQRKRVNKRVDINLDLLDYLRPYSDGSVLTDIGIYQPPKGIGDTKLAATKEDYHNIRVGTVTCECEDENTVVIHATARFKPDDEDAHKTDQWGYTETEPIPAMRLTDLSETETDLIEHFVPVAVEEAEGFANFRETATKTNSLVDRLEALTLPKPNDVVDDLDRYIDAVERAEKLDEKIAKTDQLIDEIVYELYGLTDEEIEIVEELVSAD